MYPLSLAAAHVPPQGSAPPPCTVHALLERAAAQDAEKILLIEADHAGDARRRLTARQLLDAAQRMARHLAASYPPGTPIAVMAPNCPEWVILEFAASLAGLVLVTVNPAYQLRELIYVLDQSGAAALFIVHAHRGNPIAAIAQDAARAVPGLRAICDLEDPRQFPWSAAGATDPAFAGSAAPAEPALPHVKPSDAVQIQYTSGTTGFPKGVVLHHHGLTANAQLVFDRLGATANDVTLNMMPMFHTGGCAVMTLGSLGVGAAMVLARQFDAAAMVALVERFQVTRMLAVPTMLTAMLQVAGPGAPALQSLQAVLCGGSPVPPDLVRRAQSECGCRIAVIFGQTESSPVLTQTWLDDCAEDIAQSCGQPLPATELAILPPSGGAPLPIGQAGEICARAPWVMHGYHNDAQATAAAIDGQGWLHTGDIGTLDQRGYLRVTGRVKEMIIRGGENLFPAEIEHVLREHASVLDVAVIGVPDPYWGETVAAILRVAPGHALDIAALTAHCRARMAAPKTPAHWRAVEAFPLTPSGKVQKFALRDAYLNGALD